MSEIIFIVSKYIKQSAKYNIFFRSPYTISRYFSSICLIVSISCLFGLFDFLLLSCPLSRSIFHSPIVSEVTDIYRQGITLLLQSDALKITYMRRLFSFLRSDDSLRLFNTASLVPQSVYHDIVTLSAVSSAPPESSA